MTDALVQENWSGKSRFFGYTTGKWEGESRLFGYGKKMGVGNPGSLVTVRKWEWEIQVLWLRQENGRGKSRFFGYDRKMEGGNPGSLATTGSS